MPFLVCGEKELSWHSILRCKTRVVLTTGGACSALNHTFCMILQMLSSSGAAGIKRTGQIKIQKKEKFKPSSPSGSAAPALGGSR